MVASVATLRARRKAEIAYLFVPDGLPYAWVTEHGTTTERAALLGSGAGTWASTLPASIGPRTILRGLEMPRLRESFDVKTGLLDQSQVSFRITDHDGVLNALLATEGKSADILSENIPPGTSALGASVSIQGGLTVNPRGRYIGLERIGPAGERCYFSCFPWTRIGPHHPVNVFGAQGEGPPQIPISADPVIFNGRRCAVYRLYKDPDVAGYTAWPDLEEQYEAGGLLWWGKMIDRGTIDANRTWSLAVEGPASYLRRTLNRLSFSWKPVEATTVLSEEERYVGIEFQTTDTSASPHEKEIRNSIGFLSGELLTAAGTKDIWIGELQTLFDDVASGATTDYGSANIFDDYAGAQMEITDGGEFRIRRDIDASPSGSIQVNVVLHEKVWRTLGFDPPLQATDDPEVDEFQLRIRRLPQGQEVSQNDPAASGSTTAPNYWRAKFHSTRLGAEATAFVPYADSQQTWQYNDGSWRVYAPLLDGDPSIIPEILPAGGLPLRLSIDAPWCEGQPTVPFLSTSEVDGTPCDQARYAVIRGKRQPATVLVDGQVFDPDGKPVKAADVDSEDEAQAVRVSWVAPSVGEVGTEDDAPTMILEKWMDARVFGINRIPIKGEWAAENDASAEFRLELAPLAVYGANYMSGTGEPTPSHQVLFQLLLSTGTASGWDAAEEALTVFVEGDNTHPPQAADWCVDAERWDMGLAIDYQLVQEPDDAVAEFDAAVGSDSAFNKQSFAFVGPYESLDVISSIIQPRGLAMTLRGNRYGLVHLGPFSPDEADFTIDQDSIHGDPNDPTTTWPRQRLRSVGELDVTTLSYRGDPMDEGATQKELKWRARDLGGMYRSGDVELTISDLGLTPQSWNAPGVQPWEPEATQFWETQRPTFYSRRHFDLVNVRLHRVAGQDIRPGAKVRVTNPWPVNPAAGYGLIDAVGIVTGWELDPDTEITELEILVFADQFDGLRVFMPLGVVTSWTPGTAVLTIDPDGVGHGSATSDAERFMEPPWSGGLGEMRVRILSHNRRTWSLSAVYTVASRSGDDITLTATPTDILRDTDKYLVAAEWDQQTAANWPYHRGSVIVLDTLQFGSGPTSGWPLLP